MAQTALLEKPADSQGGGAAPAWSAVHYLADDEAQVGVEAAPVLSGQVFLGATVRPRCRGVEGIVHADQQHGRRVASQDRWLEGSGEASGRLPIGQAANRQRLVVPGGR